MPAVDYSGLNEDWRLSQGKIAALEIVNGYLWLDLGVVSGWPIIYQLTYFTPYVLSIRGRHWS